MTFLDQMLQEYPEQFKNKGNIRVLLEALSIQLQEVEEMFRRLGTRRSLQNSEGKQLDSIGDIAILSHAEARLLKGQNITFDVIDDERYRKHLAFKTYKNNSQNTYWDFIVPFKMFWTYGRVHHSYDPEWPATIILQTENILPDVDPNEFFDIPIVKAAGVTLRRDFRSMHEKMESSLRIKGYAHGSVTATRLPQIQRDHSFSQILHTGAAMFIFSSTRLPVIKREVVF